ncbi:hypothetical protein WN67_32025, partial [Mycolicibacterium obuense]
AHPPRGGADFGDRDSVWHNRTVVCARPVLRAPLHDRPQTPEPPGSARVTATPPAAADTEEV